MAARFVACIMEPDAAVAETKPRSQSHLARLFGLDEATESGLHIVKILAIMLPAFATSFQISTTFYMIFIAESLGGGDYILGLELVGILVVIQLAVQVALDYPTGVVGDWIGQRYIIASALLCYSVAFWLTSMITPETPFYIYVIIYGIFGFGASQESGAFQAWFDNNYRVAMPHDTDRKQYGVFWGKIGMIWQLTATLVLIPGSWLALVWGERWVFQFQAIFAVVLSISVLRFVRDLPGVREDNEERPSLSEYGTLLKDGVKFLGSSRFITFVILGEVLFFATGPAWWNILLFPFYFSYLLTKVAVSAFRTIIFFPQALTQERAGIWARRFEPEKWIPRFKLLQFSGFVFYMLLALVTIIFSEAPEGAELVGIYIPLTNLAIIEIPIQSILPVALIFTIFLITGIFGNIGGILTQRIMIDVIPSRIRNSMYSLQPTLVMLCSMPIIVLFGWLVPNYGFPMTFTICALIALSGALTIRKGFSYPIPMIKDIEVASEEEREEVKEMDVI
jgi:MFS family permease